MSRFFAFWIIFFSYSNVVICLMLDCERNYHLSKSAESDNIVLDLRVNSTLDLEPAKEYIYLTDVLKELDSSDCNVSLIFHSGSYILGESINITTKLTRSIIMSAHDSEAVIITCNEIQNNGSISKPQLWFAPHITPSVPKGTVGLHGINFQSCAYSMRFDYLEELTVTNCVFKTFNSPALDISSILNVRIVDCKFIANNVSSLNDRFRAGAAGFAVAYYFQAPPPLDPILSIESTKFINNTAVLPTIVLNDQIEKILNEDVYPARGGGVSLVIINSYANITVLIKDCEFFGNYAGELGGGFYISMRGSDTNHSFTLSNIEFENNRCMAGGGALVVAFNTIHTRNLPSVVEILDCSFTGNSAATSGAILMVQLQNIGSGNFVAMRRTNFSRNIGYSGAAAVTLGAVFNVQSRQILHASIIETCIFTENNSPGGVMIASFNHIDFIGNTLFINNQGPSLRATGSFLRVRSGNLTFHGNNGERVAGGVALYMTALSQLKIYNGSHINFQNNYGSVGAAIRVDLPQLPLIFSEFITNPLCFFHYEEQTLPPTEWPLNLIHFNGNHALLGSAIYVSYVDVCSYYTSRKINESRTFDVKRFIEWPIFDFGENVNTQHVGNKTDKRFYVQTSAVKISPDSSVNNDVNSYPGEDLQLNIIGLDQFDNPTYFVGRIVDRDESLSVSLSDVFNVTTSFDPPTNYSVVYEEKEILSVIFSPSLIAFIPSFPSNTEFVVELTPSQIGLEGLSYDKIVNNIQKQVLLEIQNSNQITLNLDFSFTVLPCPPGYELQTYLDGNNSVSCVCSGARDNQFAVLDCVDERRAIIIRDGFWCGFHINTEEASKPYLDVYTCPVTYCQCQSDLGDDTCIAEFISNQINRQCHPPREGPLCATCGNGTTVTVLRLQCKENCRNSYAVYYATTLLAFADGFVIVAVLMASVKFGIPFPHSLKGLVFYIQTVYIATEYFPISFWDSRQYMLYLSNLLGLYFPVDFCFVHNAPTVLSFLPRFVPVLVLMTIAIIMYLAFKRTKIHMWHGIWAIVQLLYVPLAFTCIMILNCQRVPDTSGYDNVNRWFLDANIKCFDDLSHIIIGSVAIIFLFVIILLIPLVAGLVLLEDHFFIQVKFPGMINVIMALKAGYRSKFLWWSSAELLQRLLLVGILVGLPGRTVVPIIMLSFFFALNLYFKPHKHLVHDIIEALVLLNYLILLMVRSTQSILDSLDSYTGILIPSKYGSELPNSTNITYVFSLLFYLPVIFGFGICTVWICWKLWQWFYDRKMKGRSTKKIQDLDVLLNDSEDMDRYYDHDSVKHQQKYPRDSITSSEIEIG